MNFLLKIVERAQTAGMNIFKFSKNKNKKTSSYLYKMA